MQILMNVLMREIPAMTLGEIARTHLMDLFATVN